MKELAQHGELIRTALTTDQARCQSLLWSVVCGLNAEIALLAKQPLTLTQLDEEVATRALLRNQVRQLLSINANAFYYFYHATERRWEPVKK